MIKHRNIFFLCCFVFLFSSTKAFSQSDSTKEIKHINGFFQTWFSYSNTQSEVTYKNFLVDKEPYGFSLRRAFVAVDGEFSKYIFWNVQGGFDNTIPTMREAFIDFRVLKKITIRIGKTMAPIMASVTEGETLEQYHSLAFTHVPTHAEYFTEQCYLNDFRTTGLQVKTKMFSDKLRFNAMISNPDGFSSFAPALNEKQFFNRNNSFALWANTELRLFKNFRMGAFLGDGKGRDTSYAITKIMCWGTHATYATNHIKMAVEYVRGKTGNLFVPETFRSFNIDFAIRSKKLGLATCYSVHNLNSSSGSAQLADITTGINYFVRPSVTIMAHYIVRQELSGVASMNNLFCVNVQWLVCKTMN